MLKIETVPGEHSISIRLIGRLRAECIPELKAQIEAAGRGTVLGMDEVTLVDVDVVRFLGACEAQGIQLRGSSGYIREWIAREQESGT